MLIPVVHNSDRFWIDVSFGYEEQIHVGPPGGLSRYLLKNMRVNATLPDADVITEINQSVGKLMQEGTNVKEIIDRISAVYGIPLRIAEKIIKDEVLVKN